MIGTSAGGSGVFVNCDMVAEKIQAATSPSPDVMCVADGPFSPQAALLDDLDCSDNDDANINFYEEHNAVPDQSCLDQAADPSVCLRSVNTILDFSQYFNVPQPGSQLFLHLHPDDGAGQRHGYKHAEERVRGVRGGQMRSGLYPVLEREH